MDHDPVGTVLDQGPVPLGKLFGIDRIVPVVTRLNHTNPLIIDDLRQRHTGSFWYRRAQDHSVDGIGSVTVRALHRALIGDHYSYRFAQ
ncbi:hypothetical protein GCM10027089_27760 [Nocardia thraciensis]